MQKTLALVDDDAELRSLVAAHLKGHGFEVRCFDTAEALLAAGEQSHYDLYILDLMLPGMDGLWLARLLRERGNRSPILMLTARTDETDLVVGLEVGADDYVGKPVRPRELVARVRALLRRAADPGRSRGVSPRAQFGTWTLDRVQRQLRSSNGTVHSLSGIEFKLLELLLGHPGRVWSRDQIMDHLHGREASPTDRSIDLLVSKLRIKLGDNARDPRLIKTVRGEGYVLAAPVSQSDA
jgi:two-component system OmpR family response regulator